MRIKQIRFSNLNSLVGEWRIDLTDPAYQAEGIFAITGPTGAGKSTILDAICLALYGRTPRLDRITKSNNEIMSRQTGDCFAEVTFETLSGEFCCHWSQRRAHRKASGELQSPKHEISNLSNGQLIESSIKGVAVAVEQSTGMDFDRFTRSMLLAQGGFAAFLQAAADDRAPLLEQITGTEVYSQISVRVHERRAKERQQLEQIKTELSGLIPMTAEQKAAMEKNLDAQLVQEKIIARTFERRQAAIQWIQGIDRLERELANLDVAKQSLNQHERDFLPDQMRLDEANRALELSGDYAALLALREEIRNESEQLEQANLALPDVKENVEKVARELNDVNEKRQRHRDALHAAVPVLQKVRELDIQTASGNKLLTALQRELTETKQACDSAETALLNNEVKIKQHRAEQQELDVLLRANQHDALLVEQLTGLQARIAGVTQCDQKVQQKKADVAKSKAQLQQAEQSHSALQMTLDGAKHKLAHAETALQQNQSRLTELLSGKTPGMWREEEVTAKSRLMKMEHAQQSLIIKQDVQQHITQLQTQEAELTALEFEKKQALEILALKLSEQKSRVGSLEKILTLEKRIAGLEAERKQLRDDEPCPLCGATAHPYAAGNIPKQNATELELVEARKILDQLTQDMTELRVATAEIVKDLQQTRISLDQQGFALDKAELQLRENTDFLTDSDMDIGSMQQRMAKTQADYEQDLNDIAAVLQQIDAAEAQQNALREQQGSLREAVSIAERGMYSAQHNQVTAEQELQRNRDELQTLSVQMSESLRMLIQVLTPYGITGIELSELAEVEQVLLGRRDIWVQRSEAHRALSQTISVLEQTINYQIEQQDKLETSLSQLQIKLREQENENQHIRSQRLALLDERSADEEEKQLNFQLEQAEAHFEITRQELETANQALNQLRHRCDDLATSLQTRRETLQYRNGEFLHALRQAEFASEAQFTAATLPESERRLLAEKAQKLAEEASEIRSRQSDKQQQLETEKSKALTTEPVEKLEAEVAKLQEMQRQIQQSIGQIKQDLQINEQLTLRFSEKQQQTAQQQKECDRWNLLHDLIGSADGKKFRNFAQGLTFEVMVAHANRQLQKMSDRYLLMRDGSQPLELNVVDNYQAGEVRSTKNLSGGESFIVSLALALGLSQMSSDNVRVDSLFLDEGFGTLDEDALEVALETLASLQQEGKLIGVISHVGSLKERISTQLLVTPATGGRSRISGPGCSAL